MKRFFLLAAALAVGLAAVQAQKPMPAWSISEIFAKQAGITEHTNEKFDFSRLATQRSILSCCEVRDTVRHPDKPHLISVGIFAGGRRLTTLCWDDSEEVVRKDTVTKIYADNDVLECILCHSAAPGISDAEADRLRDSMRRMTVLEDTDAHRRSFLTAIQSGGAYAVQYLLTRAGIDASPLFGYRTNLRNEDLMPLFGPLLKAGRAMRIGSDIERFARKARFEEGCVYGMVTDDAGRAPQLFFYADGKFWLKYGACQYMTLTSIIDVWRLCRGGKIVPYTLEPALVAEKGQ